jgi:glycosyl transferase family 25
VRCKGRVFGIQAYLLTRKGAQALLETGTTIAEPVDWLMARYWSYKIPNYCLFPFPILERHVPSTISGSREDRYDTSLSDRAHRFYWRLKNRAVREFADRIQFRKSPFGEHFDAGPSYMDTAPHQKPS